MLFDQPFTHKAVGTNDVTQVHREQNYIQQLRKSSQIFDMLSQPRPQLFSQL